MQRINSRFTRTSHDTQIFGSRSTPFQLCPFSSTQHLQENPAYTETMPDSQANPSPSQLRRPPPPPPVRKCRNRRKTMTDTVSRNAQRRKAEAESAARAARDRGARANAGGPADGHPLRGRIPKGWEFDDSREAAFAEQRLNSQVTGSPTIQQGGGVCRMCCCFCRRVDIFPPPLKLSEHYNAC